MNIFLQTPGTYLHVKDGLFEIRRKVEGEVQRRQFAAQKVTAFLMGSGVALSTDAVALATKHSVELVFLAYDGQPYGRLWSAKLGSTTRIRKRQLEASMGAEGLAAIQDWLGQKLAHQAEHLRRLKKHRSQLHELLDEKAARIEAMAAQIMGVEAPRVEGVAESIRGWEGSAGRHYFEALAAAMPKGWTFQGRSMRPAQDAFNAALNYCYGILYSQVERVLLIAGLDPYLGFMHRDDYNQKSMVFDFIEPYRIHAERVAFTFFSSKTVRQEHFTPITGGVSLNEVGKPLLVEAFFDYLQNEKIRHRGRNLNRLHAMQLDAHRFANTLIEVDPADELPEVVEL
jgi:CRISPR-associated protein Cas1